MLSFIQMRWRATRFLVPAFLGTGGTLMFLAVAGPRIGLGTAENFFFYRWFEVTRIDLVVLGAAIAGLAVLLAITDLAWPVLRANLFRILVNGGLAVAATVASLLGAEAALRAIDGKPVFTLRNWLAERNALLVVHTMNDYDPLLGWVLRPGQSIAAADPGASFSTGPYGVRLHWPGAPAPPRAAILAVGDSFTAGSEVGDRHSWPAHLEGLLGTPVINAATGGWASDQIILRAESLLPVLEPTVVVVSFLDDDILRSGYRVYGFANKPYFTVENDALVHHSQPVPVFAGRPSESDPRLLLPSYSYLFMWTMDRLGRSDWWQRFNAGYVKAKNDPVDVSCRLLRRLHQELQHRGTRMLFVMQYGGQTPIVDRRKFAADVVGCSEEDGIETLDLWEDLAAVFHRSFEEYASLWATYDGQRIFGHMSSRGNRLVAERIAARLATNP